MIKHRMIRFELFDVVIVIDTLGYILLYAIGNIRKMCKWPSFTGIVL